MSTKEQLEIALREAAKKLNEQNAATASCRACHAPIYWVRTEHGKNMPINTDGTPHWATCPKAKEFRKSRQPGKK
jgi:hypothetical protein